MAKLTLFLALQLFWLQSAIAATWEVDRRDSRLPNRAVQFVNVERYFSDKHTWVKIQPPVGEWSQPIRCPESDKAYGFKTRGQLFFLMPGGRTAMETDDRDEELANISSWGQLVGDRDWFVSAIEPGAVFELQCPKTIDADTRFSYIETFKSDDIIEVPDCKNNTSEISCRVLHPDIIATMNGWGYRIDNNFTVQVRSANSHNDQIHDRQTKKRNSEIRGSLPKIIIIGLVIAGLILAIAVIKRDNDRDFKRR